MAARRAGRHYGGKQHGGCSHHALAETETYGCNQLVASSAHLVGSALSFHNDPPSRLTATAENASRRVASRDFQLISVVVIIVPAVVGAPPALFVQQTERWRRRCFIISTTKNKNSNIFIRRPENIVHITTRTPPTTEQKHNSPTKYICGVNRQQKQKHKKTRPTTKG